MCVRVCSARHSCEMGSSNEKRREKAAGEREWVDGNGNDNGNVKRAEVRNGMESGKAGDGEKRKSGAFAGWLVW